MKFIEAADVAFTSATKVGAFRGAVKNLLNRDYHSIDNYYSSTQLKYMNAKSPTHFKHKYITAKVKTKQTAAMILGSLVHCLLLAPQDYEKEFFIMPELNLRTNDGKAERDRLLALNHDKTPIDDELLKQAQDMRESALLNAEVRKLLEPGAREAAYFWECPFTHLPMKAKLDQSSREWFVELKTTIDASPEAFSKQAYKLDYDLSLVHYREGLRNMKAVEPPAYFIAIESDAPYVTQVYKVGDGFWETGHKKWLAAITKLENGIKKNDWPGYFPQALGAQELNPPPWAYSQGLIAVDEDGEEELF